MNILIVGGGFGGVKAALELSKDQANNITLVSDKPDFQYYPALYGAATGHNHLESWVPLQQIFNGRKNVALVQDSIISITPDKKKVTGASGSSYEYEKCILALGTVTTYFGIEGLETYAYGIKSAEEIEQLKHHLYEEIAQKKEANRRYVVVGAGPTGVELAAALGSYIDRIHKHYQVDSGGIQVDLLEAAPRVLPKMSERASRLVTRRLKKLGVNVRTGQAVERATVDSIMVGGQPITSHTVIWTSGVMNHPFYKENSQHFTLSKNGRVQVNEYMQAAEGVYVIGDNADTQYTGLAQTALHDALFVSSNLIRERRGWSPKKYKAIRPPVVVPVGESWAVFEWHWLCMGGWVASLLRRAADLVGYSDMLPIGQALGVWHASLVSHDDNIMPEPPQK